MLLLRPRTNPELLDAALELGRRLLPRLFPLAFAANLAAAVATKLLLMKSSPLGALGRVLDGSVGIVSYIPMWFLEAAAIEVLLTGAFEWAAVRRRVGRVFFRLVWCSLGLVSVSVLGSLALVVPGVLFYLGRFFANEVLLAEGPDVRAAFHRSLDLAEGGGRGRLGWLLLGWTLLEGMLAVVALLLPSGWPHLLVQAGSSALFMVIRAALNVLAYYDRRARLEGFGLAQRAERLAA